MADIQDLISSIEEIRVIDYPDLSRELVESIVKFEHEHVEDPDLRKRAQKFIAEKVRQHLEHG